MPLARFDPWQCLRRKDTDAYPAYSAYLRPDLGSLGMIGSGARFSIGDFEEPAAIRAAASGMSRHDAEHAAANDVGIASVTELRATAVCLWRHRLQTAAMHTTSELVADALALIDGPWISPLVALGWDEVSLFGYDPVGRDVVGLVAAIRARSIVAATTDSVRYRDVVGIGRHHYRFPVTTCDVCLIWEAVG
jgi:hypothetical protein